MAMAIARKRARSSADGADRVRPGTCRNIAPLATGPAATGADSAKRTPTRELLND